MKNIAIAFLSIFTIHVQAQTVIVNPDGTHSIVIDNGSTKTIVNPNGTHSTLIDNGSTKTLVSPNGTHSTIIDNGSTKTIINPNGTHSTLINNGSTQTLINPNGSHTTIINQGNLKQTFIPGIVQAMSMDSFFVKKILLFNGLNTAMESDSTKNVINPNHTVVIERKPALPGSIVKQVTKRGKVKQLNRRYLMETN